MSYLIGVIVVIVGIVVSVALHELGHMIPAKLFGVLVPRYMVGFGPTLWSTRRGETEYGIKAILLGGYVSLVGMFPPAPPSTPIYKLGRRRLTKAEAMRLDEDARAQLRPTMAEETRRENLAEIKPGQEGRAFYALSVPRKIVVMACGPGMNLLLTIVLMAAALGGVGYKAPVPTLAAVAPCLQKTCPAGPPTGPAARAGLRPGDTIVAWNGHPTPTWADLRDQIKAAGTRPVPVCVTRNGLERTLTVAAVAGPEGPTVGVFAQVARRRGGPAQIARATWQLASGTVRLVVGLPQALWHTVEDLAYGRQRGSSGVMSIVGIGRVAGQITSMQPSHAGAGGTAVHRDLADGGFTVADRVGALLSLLASLNMALFVFNLIPLLPLDGGHVLGALVEGGRRLVARVRGRGDPGPVDMARLTPLTYTVWAILVVMTLVLVVADIWDPIRLH